MDEPGLDDRHRNENGRISQKRSDTQNGNLSVPIPGFSADTTLGAMRKATGQTSIADVRDAAKGRGK